MDKHRLSLTGAALAAVVLVAGGWFVGVQPQLASASAADTQRATIESTNASNRAVLQQLEAENSELGTSKAALAALRESVPSTADTAGFTRQVQAAVTATGVRLTTLTFGTVQAYAPTGETTGSGAAANGAGSAAAPTASATSAPASTPTASATPAAPTPYRNDQVTSSTFDLVPVTVAIDATSYQQALDFTKRMQHADRLYLVDTVSQTAKEGSGTDQSWSLGGYVYVVHAATTGTTAGTSAQPSTTTSSPAPTTAANG